MRIKKHSFRTFFGVAGIVVSLIPAFILTACASGARQGDLYGGLGQGSELVPFMTSVRQGTLPNGLRYYILENTKPENRAFLTLAVNAGSVLEQDDEQGLAHFVEHMAFNGTARFPEAELLNYLRSLGMRFGAHANAYTSFDETVYGIEVPVESDGDGVKRIPEKALAVIDDWSHAITFEPKDVNDERPVIIEEYRSRLGAGERIQRKMLPIIFQGSRYENRLPIGLPEIIQNSPAEKLENFYKTWYRPDNMALILVGDFDGAALEAELASHFSAPASQETLKRPYYELPPPRKGNVDVGIFTDPEYPNIRIDLYYKRPLKKLDGTIASFRQGVIGELIDRMLSFRWNDAVAKQENPFTAAGAGEVRYGKESRYYVMVAIAKPALAQESLQALLREKESIARYGFTNTEIERTKRALISDLRRMVSEKDRQNSNSYVSALTQHFLEGQAMTDIEWQLDAVLKLLPGISAQDIAAAAKDYFASDDLRVFISAPEAEAANLPSDEASVRRLVAASRRERIARPQEAKQDDAQLIAQPPLPGVITGELVDADTGVTRWELDNGAVVLLKETQNQNNEIAFSAIARGGITSASLEDIISARLGVDIMSHSGLGSYSQPELMKKLADKQIAISLRIENYQRGFEGAATKEDLETFFELLYLSFTQPRIDQDAVGAILDQYRTQLAQRNENPEAYFSDELLKTAYSNSPWFKPLELSDLSKIDVEHSLAFVKRGLNPADYTFVFTGNLDLPVLRDYVETYLASIPRTETWNTWSEPDFSRPVNKEQKLYKGKEDKSMVFLAWFLQDAYTELKETQAAVLSEYLDITLNEGIREKLGGVYSILINVSQSLLPGSGELMMQSYFICEPRRAEELSAAVVEQIRRIARGDINGDTFTKAAEALKKQFEQSMESNRFIAQHLASNAAFYQAPLSRLTQWPALYSQVKQADIQDMARRLLERSGMTMILYPEGWIR
ncbi:MAG: insulinase family protein [Treponema sp.]|jgi:zinc protease|nr:insulinase family protein [Treponema sp.]